jgi:hypothetical protein
MTSSSSPPAFDATQYPRTYAPSLANRVIWLSFGSLLVGAGAWGVWYSLVAGDELGPKGPAVIISLSVMLLLLGIYLIASMLSSKVILKPDAVEVRSLFSRQILLRQEIMGRRFFFPTATMELIPRQNHAKKFKIAILADPDAAFAAWFESIPDLGTLETNKNNAKERGSS